MDSSRKKWRRTTVISPTTPQGRRASSGTPLGWNMSPNEDSNTLTLCDSPGPDGLRALSLDTPKRKAAVLGESTPSLGKAKLRKLSRKMSKKIISPEVNLALPIP